jgi:hypothetical protein
MTQQTWRRRVARHAPPAVRNWVAATRLRRLRRHNGPRPAVEVFSEIYANGRWGSGRVFDSGSGSHGDAAKHYAAYIRMLLRAMNVRMAVDIGCGDFSVAAQFVGGLETYCGIDIVPDLVTRNQSVFGRAGVTFAALDASRDDLPTADVCLIRQVLQHLSNDQIGDVLNRCRAYPLVVVTEHWPAPAAAREPNVDKPHGPDTRLDSGSWVDIRRPPFNCDPVWEVLRVPVDVHLYHAGETITTQLWCPPHDG